MLEILQALNQSFPEEFLIFSMAKYFNETVRLIGQNAPAVKRSRIGELDSWRFFHRISNVSQQQQHQQHMNKTQAYAWNRTFG